MRVGIALLMVVAFAGSLSCSSRVTSPLLDRPIEKVSFELITSGGGSAGAPVIIEGFVRNEGTVAIWPIYPCPAPRILIYDAGQSELLQTNPSGPQMVCIGLLASMEPGRTLHFSITFDGHYFNDAGDRLMAPAGTYTAACTFKYEPYGVDRPSGTRVLMREVSFNWQ